MKTLVLVHGFMGGSAQWDCLTPHLAEHFDLITPDLPGFGANSDMSALDRIEAFADWVIEDLRRKGETGYHLLGHSMGGMIAQEIARKDRDHVERLVLYATGAVGVLPGRFETIAQSKHRARQDGAEATASRIAATWFLDGDTAPRYAGCAAIARQARLPALEAGLNAMEAWSGAGKLSDLEQETLVLWGDRDRTYAWEQTRLLWSEIPHTSLAVVPGCAHAVHLEKPSLFSTLVTGFLTEGAG